ncbi:YbhB/YbcL family Raf kinase inhibitor-like protein [Bordetella bronchialis]|uniref:YbhB/YbcL family Raf kinase inhibitor-like protein n=1 Tax=Bordetella bronchialis TaxID=463025 RepID=UPI003D083C5E
MPDRYALSRNSGPTTLVPAENLNPQLAWDDVPEDTASFALLCVDLDAPEDRSGVNNPGIVLAGDSPRGVFYHWVLADLPGTVREIDEGAFVALPGDPGTAAYATPPCRRGRNDYAGTPGRDESVGQGYGGPEPPWNDARSHRYRFTVYALSVPRLELPEPFTGRDVVRAMQGLILAECSLTGTYTLNPALAATQVGSPSIT